LIAAFPAVRPGHSGDTKLYIGIELKIIGTPMNPAIILGDELGGHAAAARSVERGLWWRGV